MEMTVIIIIVSIIIIIIITIIIKMNKTACIVRVYPGRGGQLIDCTFQGGRCEMFQGRAGTGC